MRLLEVAALAAFATPIAARGNFDFRVSQPRRLVAIKEPSPNHVTGNTISLGRANSKSNSLSAGYLQAIRAGNHVDGIYSRLRVRKTTFHHQLRASTDQVIRMEQQISSQLGQEASSSPLSTQVERPSM